jgi:hypothetical protein
MCFAVPARRFFDMDENSSGKLAGALAQDAAVLRGAVGDTFGVVAQNLSVMAGGCDVCLPPAVVPWHCFACKYSIWV